MGFAACIMSEVFAIPLQHRIQWPDPFDLSAFAFIESFRIAKEGALPFEFATDPETHDA